MKNLILSLLVFSVFNALAQPSAKNTPYFSEKNISIYVSLENCINQAKGTAKQYVLIQIVNTSSSEVAVSFDKEIWYDTICQTCGSSSKEYKVNVVVPAHSSITGSCDNNDSGLRIFSKMLNLDKVRKLTKYELKNITIENAQ